LIWPLFFVSIIQNSYAEESKTLGIIESLESLIKIHKDETTKLRKESNKNPRLLNSVNGLNEIKFNPVFFKSLLFKSEYRYLQLANDRSCSFDSLLINGLVKSPFNDLSNLAVNLKIIAKDGQVTYEDALISTEDYLNLSYKKECFSNKQILSLFKPENIAKTVTAINFISPKNQKECFQIQSDWKNNPYLPYLCRIPEDIMESRKAMGEIERLGDADFAKLRALKLSAKKGLELSEIIPLFHKNYLKNMCDNLDAPEQFCLTYLNDSIWNKILTGEKPPYHGENICRMLSPREELSSKDLSGCFKRLIQDPDLCSTLGIEKFPSLYPRPSCLEASDGLNFSNLYSNYHDCPGKISQESIVNIHRIISHITHRTGSSQSKYCDIETTATFAKTMIEFGNENAWPLKICYHNKFEGKEECTAYVPGESDTEVLAENKVIEKILTRMYGAPSQLKCHLVELKRYKPTLLEFKNGCFLVYDKDNCTTQKCPKKILYGAKEYNEFKYIGIPQFEYFPSTFGNAKFSASEVLKEIFRIEPKKITNFTELKVFFDQNSKGIIHGVGCAQDIYPEHYPRRSMNQCTPLPFIIDGISKQEGEYYLVLRTSIDDVLFPRLILWNYIFSAVVAYSELHPVKLWPLYGIK